MGWLRLLLNPKTAGAVIKKIEPTLGRKLTKEYLKKLKIRRLRKK